MFGSGEDYTGYRQKHHAWWQERLWAMPALLLSNDDFDEKRFLEAAKAITQLTAQGDFSPYERAVFAVVHHYEKYKEGTKLVPHADIVAWLDKLNPELLSAKPGRGADGKSYPSPKEDWYTSTSG